MSSHYMYSTRTIYSPPLNIISAAQFLNLGSTRILSDSYPVRPVRELSMNSDIRFKRFHFYFASFLLQLDDFVY